MRPHKKILLCCSDEFRAAELRMILELRLRVKVTFAPAIEKMAALKADDFHAAVIVGNHLALIDLLRSKGVSTLEIGKSPSYADRVVSGEYMMDVLEAVKVMCARKRGPKKVAA